MHHLALTICLLTGVILTSPEPSDASPEERFAEAQATFNDAMSAMKNSENDPLTARRQFYDAAEEFARVYEDGTATDHVCVNAGNAYHFAGDEARALLWYLRAVKLSNSPETRAGLASLRRACGAQPWPPEQASILRVLMSWHHDVHRSTKQWIVLIAYPAGCVLIVLSIVTRRKLVLRRVGITLLVIGLVFGLSDLITAVGPQERRAVVLEQIAGHAGNAETYSVVVEKIKPGQEAKLLETREGWVRLELPSGTTCWVLAETCEQV
jgi:hypothetical protein